MSLPLNKFLPSSSVRLILSLILSLTTNLQLLSPLIFSLSCKSFNLYPPTNQHCINPAERAICTAKNHFLAVLSAAHISFPPNRWPALLPLTQLTLNHLRPFALDPSISAWHGLHRKPMDFASHPIHPAGQLVVSHDPPQQRASWALHGTRGFYLSPALSHYRSHVVFIPATLATRITNRLDFFPDLLFTFEDPTISAPPPDPTSDRPSPTLDGSDLIGRSFVDPELGLCRVIGTGQPNFLQPHTGNLAPGLRLSPGWHPTLSYTSITGRVDHSTVTEVARWILEHPPPTIPQPVPHEPPVLPLSVPVVLPPTATLRSRPQRRQSTSHVPTPASPQSVSAPPQPTTRSSPPLRGSAGAMTPHRPTVTWSESLIGPSSFQKVFGRASPHPIGPSRACSIPFSSPLPPSSFLSHNLRPPSAGGVGGEGGGAGGGHVLSGQPLLPVYPRVPLPPPSPFTPTWFESASPTPNPSSSASAPVLNLDGRGEPLIFRSALAGPQGVQWRQANGTELVKLVETSRSLTPVHSATSLPTYLNNVVKEKWFSSALLHTGDRRDIVSDVDRRVRGTAGGDRLTVSSLVSTAVASHPTVNCLFNAVVSEDALFGTVDLTDFYLGTTNPTPPFINFFLDPYPPEVLSRLRLSPFTKTDRRTGRPYCLFRADKTIYGLKESGKLSNERLVSLLSQWGFVQTSTPCLFRHPTRSIAFVLVVDDFGIKYHSRDDFDYLVQCLSTLYHVKVHPLATSFLGLHVEHDRHLRILALSYPGYVDSLLARLRPEGVRSTDTPSIYTPLRFGSTAPQSPTVDPEPLASTTQRKDIQVAIGYLMYYGRLVDSRILQATCALASEQSTATLGTIA
jgi:hypothetical protein